MTLIEFLLARIKEDAGAAKACAYSDSMHWTANIGYLSDVDGLYIGSFKSEEYSNMNDEAAAHVARWDPARVLAECEAKRRIVELHSSFEAGGQRELFCLSCSKEGIENVVEFPCHTLRSLALPHADHPDYRQEWAVSQTAPAPLA
jgi:hypothetical protein